MFHDGAHFTSNEPYTSQEWRIGGAVANMADPKSFQVVKSANVIITKLLKVTPR